MVGDHQEVACNRCILTSYDDPGLELDFEGVCNHCRFFDNDYWLYVKQGEEGRRYFDAKVAEIKEYGQGKQYDCLLGLSGGLDSSYVAYLAKQKGLRPLCVHFDNGWDTETAVQNIHCIVNKLGFDLKTYVIDWEEFKDLQLAYLKASVIDIEVLTDHAIYGTVYRLAKEQDIKYMLSGHNVATEGVLPYCWTYNKKDYVNIKAIHKEYGKRKLKSFPFLDKQLKEYIKKSKIESVDCLNWVPYEKEGVKQLLKEELGWKDYGGKHHESIWTRFYQCYILPRKFGVDKRKAHLSSLICSGQMTKEEALEEMKSPVYDPQLLKTDMDYVLKKLELTQEKFDELMKLPIRKHRDFETEGSFFNYYPAFRPLKPLWLLVRSLLKK